ncbi:MAG: prepilin-type N-terminal cleavage/methylation domain-containing protein [Chromatiales bacterium]|nr:prepilin-type N-terminal cleavage/methylation domain-containing protein [Chromatiales bacterium]
MCGSSTSPERSLRGAREGGFTLLEVVVAFAVAALSIGIIYQIYASGLRATAMAEEYTRAAMLAEAALAQTGIEEPLVEGDLELESPDEAFRLERSIEAVEIEEPDGLAGVELQQMYRVVVTARWEAGGKPREVRLETLRLANVEP